MIVQLSCELGTFFLTTSSAGFKLRLGASFRSRLLELTSRFVRQSSFFLRRRHTCNRSHEYISNEPLLTCRYYAVNLKSVSTYYFNGETVPTEHEKETWVEDGKNVKQSIELHALMCLSLSRKIFVPRT